MKQIVSIYFSAIRLLFFKWKAWLLVFVANLIFAAIIARPFSKCLDRIGANSEAPLLGLTKFDADFIADALNNYSAEYSFILSQALLFAGIYLLLNIFLSGGLIENYIHVFEKFQLRRFFENCIKHFWKMLRLAMYFLVTQLAVLGIFLTIYSKLGLSPFDLESENDLIYRTQIMLGLFVVLMAWIDMINEYAKVNVVLGHDKKFVLPSIIQSKFFCLHNLFSVIFLFVLCVLTFLGILGLYALINDYIVMKSMGTIVLALLVGQAYIFLRIGTRLIFTTSAVDFLRTKNWGKSETLHNV